MEFNEKLQELRKGKKLTQEELAQDLFVSRTAISKWESGRGYPSIDSLKEISRYFSVSIDELICPQEIISAAEEEKQEYAGRTASFICGALDLFTAILLFVPVFGNGADSVEAVSLFGLTGVQLWVKNAFLITIAVTALNGLCGLIILKFDHPVWNRHRLITGMVLSIAGVAVFIATRQPYAGIIYFALLVIKTLGIMRLSNQATSGIKRPLGSFDSDKEKIVKYYKKITLKDGRECTLRNGEERDGEAVLANFILTHEQTDYLLSYPDESTMTAEQEGRFLQEKTDSDNGIEILAEVDGVVAGLAGFDAVGGREKIRHRADFGISVDRQYWNLGIGTALMNACIECARAAGYEQIELSVVAENEPAIAMYRKAGFVEYGRNPKGFKSRFTGYQEVVYMRMEL